MQTAGTPDELLTVVIKHSRPIELASLGDSLFALAAAHARYADRNGAAVNGDPVRLYVREIRPGSVVVELMALAQNFTMLTHDTANILSFARSFIDIMRFFKGELLESDSNRLRNFNRLSFLTFIA